eukprot:7056391-Prorocentrum_lima.AAC.1
MTSSLVGSEMCIRDRPLEAGLLAQPEEPELQRTTATMRSTKPDKANSVSYTHLTLPTICSV